MHHYTAGSFKQKFVFTRSFCMRNWAFHDIVALFVVENVSTLCRNQIVIANVVMCVTRFKSSHTQTYDYGATKILITIHCGQITIRQCKTTCTMCMNRGFTEQLIEMTAMRKNIRIVIVHYLLLIHT